MCGEVAQATLLSGNSWTPDTVHGTAVFMLHNTQCGMGVQRETHEVSLSATWLSVGRWGQAEGEGRGRPGEAHSHASPGGANADSQGREPPGELRSPEGLLQC